MKERFDAVTERLVAACERSGRNLDDVTLVAVSKTFPASAIEEAYGLGMRIFGESRVQEAVPKVEALSHLDEAHYHFIGHLQSNKAKQVAGVFDLVHSVDRESLAAKLDEAARDAGIRQDVLVQVNLAKEPQKSGVHEEDLSAFLDAVMKKPGLRLRGLMMIPPFDMDESRLRELFFRMRQLFDDTRERLRDVNQAFDTLSMGMSGDFDIAIEEGSTMVRVGSAIFGRR